MAREIASTSFSNGPKFMKTLKDAGEISNTLSAWYLSADSNTQSYVELGGYSTSIIRSGAAIEDFALFDSFFWSVYCEGFRIGSSDTLSDGTVSAY